MNILVLSYLNIAANDKPGIFHRNENDPISQIENAREIHPCNKVSSSMEIMK
jgi:hypothetical protein